MRNSKPLTEKQKDILNFIETYIEEFGYPPSIRDIQNNCDISSTSVVKYNLDRRVSVVKRGRILFEIGDVPEDIAKEALIRAGHKLPIATKIISREELSF